MYVGTKFGSTHMLPGYLDPQSLGFSVWDLGIGEVGGLATSRLQASGSPQLEYRQ